ncbi:hypothetical protein [Aeromonas veronii]|uniref:hypothetical protein n=1 Tax=Aeromonas veronii TaxID=654 RepID=UPI0034313C0C
MLLFGVIRRKQQIILSYIQNSKWNSVCNGQAAFCAAIKGGVVNDAKESDNQRQAASSNITKTENAENRREADASLLVERVFT